MCHDFFVFTKNLKIQRIITLQQKKGGNRKDSCKVIMKKLIHFFNVTITTITVAAFFVVGALLIPRMFGIQPYVVLSGSMEPKIHTGAVAFVNTKDIEVSQGEIITYYLSKADGSEAIVTHRVIGEDEDGFITKGDTNDSEDMTRITQTQIVGTYIFSIPMLGYLLADRSLLVITAGWLLFFNLVSFVLSGFLEKKNQD